MDNPIARGGTRSSRRRADAWADLRPTTDLEHSLDDDPWAWASADPDPDDSVDISAEYVTAVLVAFDAARWLPATLESLARLQTRPARLIAIDNGSTDGTRELLVRAYEQGVVNAVYDGKPAFGFGTAVKSALRQDRRSRNEETAVATAAMLAADERHWLWLLHDDAIPAPDALQIMLAHVASDPSIDITGPKLLLPKRRHGGQPISEVGVSISGTGRRELAIDTGEIDQGQRDQPRERLGVSTCAMLVRTAVWTDLDGLDPALPVFRDGVEFGWRAHLNGYRVVTTPLALVTHRQVGRAGLRPRGLTGRRPGKTDRLLGMVVVAGHAPGAMLPLVWMRLVLSSLGHALAYLVGKVPGRALDEILALAAFVAHPGQIAELRTRTATIDPAPGTGEVVQRLRPPWWNSFQVGAEVVGSALADRYHSVAGDIDAVSLDELTGDDFSSVAEERANPWLSPIVITLVVTVVASLVAARQLFGAGSLAGPALLPAYERLGQLWHTVVAPIPGAPGEITPPWVALMALGSTALLGRPEWFSTVLVCGVVPLALLVIYPVVRRLVNDRRVRLWAAGTYALLPVLLGGTNQGRLSLSVFAIGLPLLVTAVRALVLRRVRTPEAWRGGWGAGVVLTALVAFEPSMMIVAVVLGVAGAVLLRRTPRKIGRIGIALGLPLLVMLPWLPSLIAEPGRIFAGPDALLDQPGNAPDVWRLLLGRGVGGGVPPLWLGAIVFGVIWLVALIGLGRRADRRAVVASWVTALVALAMAVVLSRLVVAVPPVGTDVRPWVGAYLLTCFGALVLAGAIGLDGLTGQMQSRSFSWLQPVSVLATLLVGLVTVGAASWWVAAGATGSIERTRLDAIPPYVLNGLSDDSRVRVLAIDLSGRTARYSVLADDQVRLGDADRGLAFGGSAVARDGVADLVVRLVAGTADADIAPQLGDLGVGYVWVTGGGVDVTARIDNTPGLGTASGNDRGTVWQLSPAVTRASITAEGLNVPVGLSPTVIPAGPAGRVLKIGEPADRRWQAELDGRTLTPTDGGWQQAYVLPAEGGRLSYRLPTPIGWLVAGQGLLLLVAGVLAAPGVRRPEVRDPTKSARRAATLSEVV